MLVFWSWDQPAKMQEDGHGKLLSSTSATIESMDLNFYRFKLDVEDDSLVQNTWSEDCEYFNTLRFGRQPRPLQSHLGETSIDLNDEAQQCDGRMTPL